MCTLILAFKEFSDSPIVVAANRDEQQDRPSSPPELLETTPRSIGPVDRKAGGTWIGFNEKSVFTGITNRWSTSTLPADRSRGLLVRDVLNTTSAKDGILTVINELLSRSYDGFNLVIADPTMAYIITWDGTIELTALHPGVHVVMNAGFNDSFTTTGTHESRRDEQATNAKRIRNELKPINNDSPAEWLERAQSILSDHDYGVCVHDNGYGTRSSSLITIFDDEPSTYLFADGPPCEHDFTPVNDQF